MRDRNSHSDLLFRFGRYRCALAIESLASKENGDNMRIWPGRPYPLGATWDGAGVNFALFPSMPRRWSCACSMPPEATDGSKRRIVLPEHTDQVWHAYLPDVEPGQLYGYRVHGPMSRPRAIASIRNKVMLDPYAKAIGRDLRWDDSLFGYKIGDARRRSVLRRARQCRPFAPLGAVIDTAFTWGDDRPPRTPWHKTLIYELHVKGFTMRHPDVPEKQRGTLRRRRLGGGRSSICSAWASRPSN